MCVVAEGQNQVLSKGKSIESHAEMAGPPTGRKHISGTFGLLSQSMSYVSPYEVLAGGLKQTSTV